jgi:ABC-2 type transport system ATP-binding protein
MNDEPAIELRGVTKAYGDKRALDDVSLIVRRGEVFGYLGPNGAGKTTTIKILTGLLKPTAGDALVTGRSVLGEALEVKARVGYVPESGALYEKLTPAEYLSLVGQLYKLAPERIAEGIDRWLARFRLTAERERPMHALSKGTRQKVCWMAALLHEPDVLVLDEPLNALDVEAVALAKDVMSEIAASGRTIFYSSHLMDVVARVCSRVAVLVAGRLVACGSPQEVIAATGAEDLEQALLRLCREPAP